MSSKAASFDGIHRDAADRVAAMMFAGGVQYRSTLKYKCAHWESPPFMRTPPAEVAHLIGKTFGRFTVIGLHKTILGGWVVRCACGDYETRKARSIRNPNNFGDRCAKCRQVAFERKDYEFRKTGREIDQRTI